MLIEFGATHNAIMMLSVFVTGPERNEQFGIKADRGTKTDRRTKLGTQGVWLYGWAGWAGWAGLGWAGWADWAGLAWPGLGWLGLQRFFWLCIAGAFTKFAIFENIIFFLNETQPSEKKINRFRFFSRF